MYAGYRLSGLLAVLVLLTAAWGQDERAMLPGSSGLQGMPAHLNETGASRDETFVSDVFFGRNTKGPYLLAWNEVVKGSETVLVDGMRMSRDRDYTLDYKSGSLIFLQPLKHGSICRVRYAYNAATARKNQASINIPLTFDLLQSTSAQYRLSFNYQQKDVRSNSPGRLVAALGGKSRLSDNTELSSAFLMTPKAAGEISSGDRTAFRLGTSTRGRNYQFTTSFAQAGSEFRAAKENGLEAGRQVMDLTLAYQPSDILTFQSSVNRSAAVEGANRGETALVSTQNVVMTFKKAPKVTATHQTVDANAPTGPGKRMVTDRLQLDHHFGKNTAATLEGYIFRDGESRLCGRQRRSQPEGPDAEPLRPQDRARYLPGHHRPACGGHPEARADGGGELSAG